MLHFGKKWQGIKTTIIILTHKLIYPMLSTWALSYLCTLEVSFNLIRCTSFPIDHEKINMLRNLMSNNQISGIGKFAFVLLHKLEVLDSSNNNISILSSNSIYGLLNLKSGDSC